MHVDEWYEEVLIQILTSIYRLIEAICVYQSQYRATNGGQSRRCGQIDDHEEARRRRCSGKQGQEDESQEGWKDRQLISSSRNLTTWFASPSFSLSVDSLLIPAYTLPILHPLYFNPLYSCNSHPRRTA